MTEDEINLYAYTLLNKLEVTPLHVELRNKVDEDEKTIIGLGTPFQLGKIENAVRYKSDDYDNITLIHKVIDNKEVGFGEKSYIEIQNLTDILIEIEYFNSLTDYQFIEREIFNWVIGIYENNKAEYELTNYLKIKLENQLHDYEYFFKISSFGIEKEFSIGKVTFSALSENFFEEEFKKMNYHTKDKESEHMNKMIDDYTKKVVARTKSYATNDRAYNLSIFNVRLSLNSLKLFMLWESLDRVKMPHLEESNTNHFLSYMSRSKPNNFLKFGFSNGKQPTIIDEKKFEELKKMGLEGISNFILLEKKDELYTEIINGINILGESYSSTTLYERVVKIISFFESFLIPEGNTAGKGLTYVKTLITKTEGPSDLTAIIIRIYDIRDKYLHNRIEKKINPYDLYKVQLFAIVFIINLIELNTKFKTKSEVQLHFGISNKLK